MSPPLPPGPTLSPRPRNPSKTSTTSRTLAYFETSGAPAGGGAYDLPSSSALADLELVPSSSRVSFPESREYDYRGGGGLGRSASRVSGIGGAKVVGKEGKIEEDLDEEAREGGVVDEEAGVGKGGEVILETEAHAQRMYARFSDRRRACIVAVVAYAAFIAPFCSSAFLPSIPSIALDLNTSATILNITVAIFIVVIAVTPLIWAPFSGVYGRRPIYLISLPICTLGSMGAALSPNLTSLIITRMIQGGGACAVLSVGAGTIGDIYPRERRGKAMGFFYSGILLGPSLAPAIAGVLTEYVPHGWRAMQWLLCAMGGLSCVLVFFVLPETSHIRGVDVIREERRLAREAAAKELKAGGGEVAEKKDRTGVVGWWERWTEDWVAVFINPLAPLRLLARPHILAMSINSSFVLMSAYTILVPLSETLAPRYNITNSAILGCLYIAQGIGNYVASQFTGRYSDYTLRSWLRKRGGVYVAEDRLKATLVGGGVILPLSVLGLGWTIEKGTGTGALVGCIILLFVDGVGQMIILTPANTYCVDVMQHRSAEVIAVNNCVRYLFSAAASAFVLPMIQKIGVGWTNTFAAVLVWIGFALVLVTIRYGDRMRRWGNDGDALEDLSREKEKEKEAEASEEDGTVVADGSGDGDGGVEESKNGK